MTSRERVIAAITFRTPDRIPMDIWPVPASFKRHGKALESLFERWPIDFVHPNWPSRWDPETLDPTYRRGSCTDEWGVVWECAEEGYSGMDVGHPLADWKALEYFRPPAVGELAASCDKAMGGGDRFRLAVGPTFWHRMCFLRGMGPLMMDLADDVPEVYRLREMLLEHFAGQVSELAKSRTDGVIFLDDWGAQNRLLIPPAMWRSFFKPVYRELFSICKRSGKYVFFHSDGCILDIIEDFIELGVDALNSQVWCMGPETLGKRFRGRITFWGEVNRQATLPHGTPGEVRQAAARLKAQLATPHGGLIGQGEIDGLTPFENIEALFTAWNQDVDNG